MPKKNELEQNPQPANKNNVPEEKTKQQLLDNIARAISGKNEAIKKKESGGKYKPSKSSRKRALNAVKGSESFKTLEAMSVQELENLSKMSGEDLHTYWQGVKEDTKAEKERLGMDKDTKKVVEELKPENDAAQKQVEQEKKDHDLAEKLNQQELEQIGEDDATKKVVQELKSENDKAQEQIEQEKKDHDLAEKLNQEELAQIGEDDATKKVVEELKPENDAAQKQIEQEKKDPDPVVKQETVKKEGPQQSPRTYAIPLTPEHVMQATADMEPLKGKLPKLKNVDESAVLGHLYNIAVAAAVGKDAIASLDMNEPGAKEDLSKSLADVMVMQVIQTGIESNDPDFNKALDTPGGLQKMERILKENPIFRDMVNKPDTPEAATELINNSTRAEKYRFARNAALVSMKPEKIQEVSEPAAGKTQEGLQNEEKEKEKIDKLFGKGAYEESKKVQAEKEKFEKVFGEGTFTPYKEKKAKFENVFGKGTYGNPSQKKTIDAKPFVDAISDMLNDEGMQGPEYQDMKKVLTDFVTSSKKAPAGHSRIPVIKDNLQAGFKRLTDAAKKLQEKVAGKTELGANDWAGLKKANNIHTLNYMIGKGVGPDSKEGVKIMMAAKIACGGSRSFTDGKEFACNPEKFMKTVDLICKSPSFKDFTAGKSMEELNNLMEMSDEGIFSGFNKQMELTKQKKLTSGQKSLETTVNQKKPQSNEKKETPMEQAANVFAEFGNVSKEQGMAMAKQLKGLMQGGVSQENIMKEMMKNPEFKKVVKAKAENAKEKKKLEQKQIKQEPLKKEKKKEVAVGM